MLVVHHREHVAERVDDRGDDEPGAAFGDVSLAFRLWTFRAIRLASGNLVLHHDPHHTVERHLLSFGLQLRAFVLDHPGLGTYMQILFPRGDAGRRLMADEIVALCRAGYNPDVAVSVASVVAGSTINTTVADETQRLRVEGLDERRRAVSEQLDTDDRPAEAHRELPAVDAGEFSKLVLATTIRGLVAVPPPGRPLKEVVADLAATGLGK